MKCEGIAVSMTDKVDVSKLISDLDEDIRNGSFPVQQPSLPLHTSSGTPRTAGSGGGRQQTASPVNSSRMPVSQHHTTPGAAVGPRILASSLPGSPIVSSVASSGGQNPPKMSSAPGSGGTDANSEGLKMKIKRTKSGRQEIVKADISGGGGMAGNNISGKSKSLNGDSVGGSDTKSDMKSSNASQSGAATNNGVNGPNLGGLNVYNSSSSGSSAPVSSSASSSGGDSCPPSSASGESSPRSPHAAGSPAGSTANGGGKSDYNNMAVTDMNGICNNKGPQGYTDSYNPAHTSYNPLSSNSLQMLTSQKLKVDVGTVTDASTVTEPEILGPCEPGTPVNLDGIVWHETDTGVLVVNVTWRGKTYVGTLLDCAKHTNQWSAPRFTDSPEPGGKGRGKRSRNSATPAELEPRKNLRSSKGKGKGGKGNKGNNAASAQPSEDEFNFPAPASPKEGGKRKKEADPNAAEDSKKRKRTSSDSDEAAGGGGPEEEELKPPLPVPIKREPKPVVYSYTMLECPRKDCNKQYKAEDGLKWHVSHSHPEFIGADGEIRDSADVEREEQERKEEQERRRRAARQEKEERKKKEASLRLEMESKGTPAKHPKLDDTKSQPTTPVPESGKSSKPPAFPTSAANQSGTASPLAVPPPNSTTNSTISQPWNNPPEVQALPTDPSRLFEDNLKKMKATIDSLSASPMASNSTGGAVTTTTSAISGVTMSTPRSHSVEKSKVPATSPAAFSDISDDGEDSRIKDLKLNTSLDMSRGEGTPQRPVVLPGSPVPHTPQHSAASLVSHHPHHHPNNQNLPQRTSSPLARPHPQPAAPPASSSMSTQLPRSSVSLPGSGVPGPEPGTPEYHKYLAANGFPPFPYPYPVGMDPNYHMQLLKTDPVYKAKWEKDRAERMSAFKEQLDKDQGRFSGLSLVKDERLQASPVSSQQRKPHQDNSKPEDLRKREPSGDSRPTSRASPMISVKPEFREKEELKKEVKNEDQGVKPTMETRGPPPGPQTFGYMHPSLVRPPYSLGGLPPPFDPMFVNSGLSPYGLPPGIPGLPNPYLNPGMLGANRPNVPFSSFGGPGDPLLRAPFPLGTAEDLARAAGAPPSLSGTKALDLLQHHASQYYANQKLAELQERALKSPISSMSATMSRSASPSVSKPITTLAGNKEAGLHLSSSKSPPPLRHVHTHTHTHIGLGYPFPGALPSVPGGIPPVGSLPPGALPPPPVGAPFSSPSAGYPGKSPT